MIKIGEFLDGLHRRLEKDFGALIFFGCFLKNRLVEEINKQIQDGLADLETGIADERSWDIVYNIAAEVLWDAASRNHSEVHPDIFDEANSVSEAFCEEMKERMGFNIEPIRIRSAVDVMAEEGFIEVKNGHVKLTQKGEQSAKEVAKEIEDTVLK